jgi:hypothetical protein
MSCFTLVSCFGTSPPDGYLATDTNSVYFIQFTETNNQLSGHIQGIEITNDVPPQTKSSSTAFTGIQNGSSLTITISVFGFSSSSTGILNGNSLTLDVPQQDGHLKSETFNGASIQQYNQAVDALQNIVSQQDQQYSNSQATASSMQATQTAQQAELQAEQQAVSDTNSQLGSALNALKNETSPLSSFSETSTLNNYADNWQTMQKDYATEQKDAQAGCGEGNYNYGTVQYDAGTVDYDFGSIQYDDGSLNYDKNTYNSELSAVQSDIQSVNNAWSSLHNAVANNTTGSQHQHIR